MKNAAILFFILFFHSAFGQQTIDKLNANQLKLPKESVNKALYLDGAGQVKSSSTISDTELGYLEGLTDTLVNLLSGKANDTDVVKLTGNQSVDGVKTFTGKLVASSTVNGSIPCPVMTEAERDLFTPVEGDCVYNSDTLKLNIFDGSVWKDVGGAGGISLWLTANPYNVNDIIIESDKIYRCLVAHTSGVFATDLAAAKWTEVSASPVTPYSLNDGGTNKALTAVNGGIVWVDADSFEILSAGVSGQVLQSNGAASPSWVNKSISGKAENGSSITLEEIQVSNNQLTQTDTNKHLVETGNTNILVNPSFEHSTFSTGWTNALGTFAVESTVVVHGKKSAKVTLSSQTLDLSQDSTLYQAQFADGVQGLASVRVKTTVSGIRVCSRQNGVVSSNLCVNVQANGKWGLYKVPFTLGGTSNGIEIDSNSVAVTGDVYVDDAFVGAVDLSATQSFDTTCDTAACETEFTAKVDSAGTVYGENQDWISSNCSYGSGVANCTLVSSLFTVAPSCRAISLVSGNTATTMLNIDTSTSLISFLTRDSASGAVINRTIHIHCSRQGSDYTAAINARKAFQKSKISSFSSTNADTDWQSCGHTTSSFAGLGTVSAIETHCKRQGSDLLMKGKFVTGTTTATETRVSLPIWNGVQIIAKSSSVIPSIQKAGDAAITVAASYDYQVLIEPSVSYFTMGRVSATQAGLSKGNGIDLFGSGVGVSFTARIPIEGWENSNIIIGQFNGLESCTNSYECTDVFSAEVSSTGTVISENIDWIDGNCSNPSTGVKRCNLKSNLALTQKLSCVGQTTLQTGALATTVRYEVGSSSTTAIEFISLNSSFTPVNEKMNIICQKQGVDYIGKTAKAVASDQNLRTPGVVKSVMYSAKVSSSGVVTDELGDFINGNCSASSPYTCTFNSNVFQSSPNCYAQINSTSNQTQTQITSTSTSSTVIRTENSSSAVAANIAFNLMCHGVSP